MSKEFKRESRYIAFKKADLGELTTEELENLEIFVNAGRKRKGKPPLRCVVVESDWPEFEPTWDAIQRRMEGKPTREMELRTELGVIHAITMCIAQCPPHQNDDTLTIKGVKNIVDLVRILETELQESKIKAEAMRLALAPLSVKAGITEEKLISILAEAEQGVRKAVRP